MQIKIHTPNPPQELLDKLARAKLNYSTPNTLFHLIWLGDTRYCGVFGDGDNGGYEWFYWDGTTFEHSDVGYGGTDVTLRDVLNKVMPIDDARHEREALRLAKPFVEAMIQILKKGPDDETLKSAKATLTEIEKYIP